MDNREARHRQGYLDQPVQPGEFVTVDGEEWEVLSVYTRAQALEDGVLVDVSAVARFYGFKVPVAITAGVSAVCENVSAIGVLLHTLRRAIVGSATGDRATFTFRGEKMWALCGPGDTPAPVITVMLEGED